MPQFDKPEIEKNLIRGFGKCTPTRNPKKFPKPCPECSGQMVYPEPGVVHMDPPRKRISCTECTYKSFEYCEEPEPGIDVYQNIIDRQAKRLKKSDPSAQKPSEPDCENPNHPEESQEKKSDHDEK